ncbi:MAG: ArnT family glycosyltransferase [Candidatus Thorarchaeota archaeon]
MSMRPSEKKLRTVDVLLLVVLFLNCCLALMLRYFGSQMYPFFIIVYIWISLYALLITLVLRRDRLSSMPIVSGRNGIILVALLAFSIRIVYLGMNEYISLDPLWYLDFGKFMLMGNLPYSDFYFPYPPVFAYFIYLVTQLAPSVDGFRFLAILFDTTLIPVIWQLVEKQGGKRWASITIIVYAMLPLSIIESGWNGHFEPLVNLFLLLSLWFLFKGRSRLTGIFLGLAIATKFYPIILFPIFLFYLKDWRRRIECTILTIISGVATFVPLYLLLFLRGNNESTNGTTISTSGFFDLLLGTYLSPGPLGIIITGFVSFCVLFGIFLMWRHLSKNDTYSNGRAYNRLMIFLGLVLILLGVIAGIYAIIPVSRMVYWRYPIDVGLVRGVTAFSIGIFVIVSAVKKWKSRTENPVQFETLFILICAILMLLAALSRSVFYGWYLLWSIPLFLFLKNRRLSLTVILCLLLVYPSYTHDNFVSLGFDEERLWSEDMNDLDQWTTYINTTTSPSNAGLLRAGVNRTDDSNEAFLWFDTRNSQREQLQNVSIEYALNADVFLDENIEFVARIMSTWDPTFGRYADLSLRFTGINQDGNYTQGFVFERASVFTNLTYILWRSSLTTLVNIENVTIQRLIYVIYPIESVIAGYYLDYMYTTYYGILNPVYFLMVPSLIALSLISFTFLHIELQHKEHEDKEPISKMNEHIF